MQDVIIHKSTRLGNQERRRSLAGYPQSAQRAFWLTRTQWLAHTSLRASTRACFVFPKESTRYCTQKAHTMRANGTTQRSTGEGSNTTERTETQYNKSNREATPKPWDSRTVLSLLSEEILKSLDRQRINPLDDAEVQVWATNRQDPPASHAHGMWLAWEPKDTLTQTAPGRRGHECDTCAHAHNQQQVHNAGVSTASVSWLTGA